MSHHTQIPIIAIYGWFQIPISNTGRFSAKKMNRKNYEKSKANKKDRKLHGYKNSQINRVEKMLNKQLRGGAISARGIRRNLLIREAIKRLLIEESGLKMVI